MRPELYATSVHRYDAETARRRLAIPDGCSVSLIRANLGREELLDWNLSQPVTLASFARSEHQVDHRHYESTDCKEGHTAE